MRRPVPALLLAALLLPATALAQQPARIPLEFHEGGPPVPTPDGPVRRPFSEAVRVGNLLFLSGQLGTGADGRLVSGGIVPETRAAMENIRRLVEKHGSSMDRVVKCLVMLADMGEWGAMNTAYLPFFPVHRPARSAFGATALALGARVEIECIAALP